MDLVNGNRRRKNHGQMGRGRCEPQRFAGMVMVRGHWIALNSNFWLWASVGEGCEWEINAFSSFHAYISACEFRILQKDKWSFFPKYKKLPHHSGLFYWLLCGCWCFWTLGTFCVTGELERNEVSDFRWVGLVIQDIAVWFDGFSSESRSLFL